MRILLIEDEERVANFIRRGLRAEGWTVEHAGDGPTGLSFAHADYDAIVLDLMLPGFSGIEVCRRLRARQVMTPILMLTALDAADERVSGLEVGADDYLTKPFEFAELVARLSALARRASVYNGHVAAAAKAAAPDAPIQFDRTALQLFVDGRPVDLSGKERELLVFLLGAPGKAIPRERILNAVWGLNEDPLTNVIDVYIGRLRRKISPYGDAISTIRSIGFRYDPP